MDRECDLPRMRWGDLAADFPKALRRFFSSLAALLASLSRFLSFFVTSMPLRACNSFRRNGLDRSDW